MIVLIVQKISLSVSDLEREPPIAIDPNRPAAPFSAFEGGLDAGQVGVTGDLVAFGGGLGVPNTVKAEGGHGEIFDEDDLSTFGGWLRYQAANPSNPKRRRNGDRLSRKQRLALP